MRLHKTLSFALPLAIVTLSVIGYTSYAEFSSSGSVGTTSSGATLTTNGTPSINSLSQSGGATSGTPLSITGQTSTGTSLDQTGSYNTGNPSLDKVFRNYESSLRTEKNTEKVKKFLIEEKNGQERKISDATRDEMISSQMIKSSKTRLKDRLAGKFASSSEQDGVMKNLVSSMKKVDKGVYRLFIKSTLSENEIQDLFSFFDAVTLKNISVGTDGKTLYELTFSTSGRLAKYIGTSLDNGEIPQNLFEGIETVEPTVIKGFTSTGTYLAGESLSSLWGMSKLGAVDYQNGLALAPKIKVGIIDTGINLTHSDLAGNIAINSKEIVGNGIDDDKNGYIDDVKGYNFVGGNANAADDHGHGTHVAGIAAGMVNGKGIFGVNSSASLVPLKVLSANGYGSSYAIVDAINYAGNNGIRVVNMSLGGDGNPSGNIICNAITAAKSKGTISIVAAGNENADVSVKVPAGCTDAITVGAVDSTLTKASFSNYGTKVDIAAPGVNIYSSYIGNTYATMNGTSMATPYITGLVASMLSYNSALSTDTARSILKDANNSIAVTSSVNIGRFPNMSKIMTSMNVKNDTFIGTGSGSTGSGTTTPPTTGSGSTGSGTTSSGSTNSGTTSPVILPPSLNLVATKVSTNVYKITATATSSGATIKNYTFSNGTTLVYSGSLNYAQLTITANTTISVKVTDSRNMSTTKTTSLTYEAPVVANQPPTVTLNSSKYSKKYNRTVITTSDSDGTVSRVDITITSGSFAYKYSITPNIAKFTVNFDTVIGTSYTFKVIATDNKGAKTEKSITVK